MRQKQAVYHVRFAYVLTLHASGNNVDVNCQQINLCAQPFYWRTSYGFVGIGKIMRDLQGSKRSSRKES